MTELSTTTDVFDVIHTCRAMRRLRPEPVPEELLVRLVDAAIHAPSSSNAQNWRFVIVREHEQKRRIAEGDGAETRIVDHPTVTASIG